MIVLTLASAVSGMAGGVGNTEVHRTWGTERSPTTGDGHRCLRRDWRVPEGGGWDSLTVWERKGYFD